MVHAELEYSSSGCNRCVGNLVWDIDGVIVFGSHHAVVVYDTTASKVVTTMLGHKDVVTSVAYVPRGVVDNASDEDSHWIVSGSADGCIVVWELCLSEARRRQQEVAQGPMWRVFQMMEGHHQGPLTWVSVETYRKQEDGSTSCVMVSSAGDGDLVVCQFVEGRFVEVQRLSFGTKLVHCAAVGFLEVHSTLLLGLGFIDGAVKLYVSGAGQNVSFSLACNLTGHQNWIRGIDFINVANDKMILATGSQDRYIRLWSIEPRRDAEGIAGHDLAPSLDALGITKYAPKPRIKLGDALYTVLLESLLVGHEDWVMNVSWNKSNAVEPMLLSSSMDRTMVVWKKDVDSGIWLSSDVVGDAGTNHLGYYSCVWSPNGDSIAAHGYTGSLHIWDRVEEEGLRPRASSTGHMASVVDSSWSFDGKFLLTVSMDQTARIFSCCHVNKNGEDTSLWCEIARPQIHGHDFSCVTMIKSFEEDIYKYASGSEEKVLRVFESPGTFLDTLAIAHGHELTTSRTRNALGATLPALGLSNKPIISDSDSQEKPSSGTPGVGADAYDTGADLAPSSAPAVVTCPPFEEHLSQNTLWPETHKLYGHGNEIYCAASDPLGRCIASASRAQSTSTASVIIWDAGSWTKSQSLEGHSLTVTHVSFSPCGAFLASVGRDRKLCLWKRSDMDGMHFEMACDKKAHSRIIWASAWSPDSKILFTASRDASIKCWCIDSDGVASKDPISVLNCTSSVRCLACKKVSGSTLLAAGFEDGTIHIYKLTDIESETMQLELIFSTPSWQAHCAAVRSIHWRPDPSGIFSTVGDDHSVKIWSIKL